MQSYRMGFVFSYVLGHVTHKKNLERWVEADASISPRWMLLESRTGDLLDKLPGVKNHMPLRMSLRARRAVRGERKKEPLDVLFYHTQITAMLAFAQARPIPTVVSLDATPIDFASLGAYHAGNQQREADRSGMKFRWNRVVFQRASALVTWSAWAKKSLVQDYGIETSRVAVLPPGVDLERWQPATKAAQAQRKTRLLFVGGDFKRKGGDVLLAAFFAALGETCELDVVSNDAPQAGGAVRVHRGLKPNSPELRKLYAEADLFVFPSRGDCTPVATIEAMASGLPIVTTRTGAMAEQVEEGVNGLLVAPDDPAALARAVGALAGDQTRRAAMGAAGRARASRWFDASKNYRAVLALLKRCADEGAERAAMIDANAFGLPIPTPA